MNELQIALYKYQPDKLKEISKSLSGLKRGVCLSVNEFDRTELLECQSDRYHCGLDEVLP